MIEEKSPEELKLQELFQAAHQDRSLKIRLLNDPKKVAEEWGVELGKSGVERLSKLGAAVEMLNEAKCGRIFQCDPRVCYPSTLWLKAELMDFMKEFIVIRPPDEGIRYPLYRFRLPSLDIDRISQKLDGNLRLGINLRAGLPGAGPVSGGVIIDG